MNNLASNPEEGRLTPSRDRALAFIREQLESGLPFPTRGQIAAHMGWRHPSSADDCLLALVAEGHLVVTGRTPSGKGWARQYALAAKV